MNTDSAPTTEFTPALTAGVIGLGQIGGAVAVNLVRAGIATTVFDVRPDATAKLEGVGPQVPTPADVARASDVVMVAVVNAAQAHEVLIGENGLLTAGHDGLVIVLLSTLAVSSVKELSALASEHGAIVLDAGVTQAGGGLLVTMIGGPEADVDHVRPVLDAFSKAVIHCGPIGSGMVTKLARNLITYSSWAVMREAVSLAVAGGVDPAKILEVMEIAGAGGPTPTSMLKGQVSGQGLTDEQIPVVNNLAQKDLSAAQEFAGEAGVLTPIADVVRPSMLNTLAGTFAAPLPEEPRERGLAMMSRVYGASLEDALGEITSPATADMVDNLFGNIWSRPNLTIRDRRLILVGSTTMIGRSDLLQVQLAGAVANGEFTDAQLDEMQLFLNYYAGIENGTSYLTALANVRAAAATD
jgi:3-hydroxyisobutyrate dehydrogenase-like beta-hydroxyacid dehydrogenase/alkylhydroperoxidase/carboxymuconolactone decarboxylase family protein YurZ